jgi:hypothetical protein
MLKLWQKDFIESSLSNNMNIDYRMSALNYKQHLLGIYIIIIYFSTPHSQIIQLFPRIYLHIALSLGLIILCLINNKYYRITKFDNFYSAILLLITTNSLSEILRWDIHRFFGWITLLIIIILIWGSKKDLVVFVTDKYIFLIFIFSLISVVTSLLFIFKYIDYTDLLLNVIIPRDVNEQLMHGYFDFGGSFLGNLSMMFLNFDTTQMVNFGTGDIRLPRLTAHLQQASLISAYFLFPLGIRLMIKKVNWLVVIVILTFGVFSQSGTVYIFIFSTIIVYIFYKYFKVFGFFIPILILFTVYVFSYILSNYVDIGGTTGGNPNFIFRVTSGSARLVILSEQIKTFLLSPILGHVFSYETETWCKAGIDCNNINLYLLGSFILGNGVRSGILGLLLSLYIYYLVIKKIFNYTPNTKQNKLGVSMVYSGIIMMMSYQDFGYSSTTGFISLSLLMFYLKDEIININYLNKGASQSHIL